jgi:hypothetical protein
MGQRETGRDLQWPELWVEQWAELRRELCFEQWPGQCRVQFAEQWRVQLLTQFTTQCATQLTTLLPTPFTTQWALLWPELSGEQWEVLCEAQSRVRREIPFARNQSEEEVEVKVEVKVKHEDETRDEGEVQVGGLLASALSVWLRRCWVAIPLALTIVAFWLGIPAIVPILSVNIDHVATLRQARLESFPDPVQAAAAVELGGADGLTVHLRDSWLFW